MGWADSRLHTDADEMIDIASLQDTACIAVYRSFKMRFSKTQGGVWGIKTSSHLEVHSYHEQGAGSLWHRRRNG
eukprot:1137702-Pelagomonas_calceolata.AAC.5